MRMVRMWLGKWPWILFSKHKGIGKASKLYKELIAAMPKRVVKKVAKKAVKKKPVKKKR